MKQVLTIIIVFVIFSFFSIPLAYGLPILWEKHVDGMIWSVDISEDGAYVGSGVDLGDNKGKVYFIDKNGNLLWSQEEDRIIGNVAVSNDGSFVLASGYQVFGRGGFYQNPSVYLFDQSGKLLWIFQNTNRTNLTPENQFLIGTIGPLDNNIIIQADNEILFLDNSGNLLWNYTADGRLSQTKISDDGSTIAVGTIHDEKDNVWDLSVFDNLGNLKWKHIGTDGIIQGNAIAISSDGQNIVIGSMKNGEVGNLYKFDKKGNILWQRHNVSGGVLNVGMSGDSSSIVVGTNNGMVLLGRDGKEIASHSTWFPTISSDGKSITSSGLIRNGEYGIALFDGKLNQIWSKPNVGSDLNKISKDGAFIIAGTRLSAYSSKSNDLYFFEGRQKLISEPLFNDVIPPPLKQFKSGIAAKDVVCKQGLELVMKKSNGHPLCVKGTSVKSLTMRDYIPYYNGALGGEIPTDDLRNEKEITTENTMIIDDKTYFFSTINQTKPWALEGKKIHFHDVTFTLFPRPSSLNLGGFCGSGTFGTSIRFPDGFHESLSIRTETECLHDFAKTDLTKLTNHTNPQAGLTVSDQEIKLLVSAENQPLFYPQKEYVDSIPLDFSNASNENSLGIEAKVVNEPDTAIMCPIENCKIPPTPHLVLTSQKGAQFVGYEVCNGLSCKKDRVTDGLYVWLSNVPENYSGANSIMIGHINLGDLPWKKDDIVHIKVIAFPATLLENNVVVRHTDQIMTVDLGKSRIE